MSLMSIEKMQAIIEAALLVAGQPLTLAAMQTLFDEEERPTTADLKVVLANIADRHSEAWSGIELQEVASGYRFQARSELSTWLAKLWEERAPRYSRAFLETLVLIAYKQPVTRAEIEEIRGVTVSSNIIKTLHDREWIRVVGHREVPGRPAIYGTTKTFLDYFNLKSLADLPTLAEFKNLEAQEAALQVELALENSDIPPSDSEVIPKEREAIADNVIPLHETVEAQDLNLDAEEDAPESING